jgi:hypothetical protein
MGEDVDQETLTRILLAVMAHEPGRGEADVDEQATQQLAALKPAGPREGDVGKAQAAAAFIMRRFGKSAALAAAELLEQVSLALDEVLRMTGCYSRLPSVQWCLVLLCLAMHM